jgi:hypothetical protein
MTQALYAHMNNKIKKKTKTLHKKGLAQWLKVQALSSSPSTTKKNNNNNKKKKSQHQ